MNTKGLIAAAFAVSTTLGTSPLRQGTGNGGKRGRPQPGRCLI